MDDAILLAGATSHFMNASGFFGFTPPNASVLTGQAGAFVTPPISKNPRRPAANRCLVDTPGGFLVHTGCPNDGFMKVLKQYAPKWAGLKLPVWTHLIPQNGYECKQMVRTLEELENIGAIEIGLPANAESAFIEEILQASLSELPIYVSVPFLSPWECWLDLFRLYTVAGIVLASPRGCVQYKCNMNNGRLYGPALFPLLLEKLQASSEYGIPLIAGSGIFSFEQAEIALQAGASAVQLDGWLWQLTAPTSPSKS